MNFLDSGNSSTAFCFIPNFSHILSDLFGVVFLHFANRYHDESDHRRGSAR